MGNASLTLAGQARCSYFPVKEVRILGCRAVSICRNLMLLCSFPSASRVVSPPKVLTIARLVRPGTVHP